MTDHSTVPESDSNPDAPDPEQTESESHDLSMRSTPKEWFEAERESPQDPEWAKTRVTTGHTVNPIPRKASPASLFLSGVVAVLLTGSAWSAAELLGLSETPWLTIPAGILIALIVRAGCGREDAEGRATVSAIAYLITLLIVLGLLTRREIFEIYGSEADVVILEENLFRRRFSRVDQLAAYVIGWAATWFGSLWLSN